MLLREFLFSVLCKNALFFKETSIFVRGDNEITLVIRAKFFFVISILLPMGCFVCLQSSSSGKQKAIIKFVIMTLHKEGYFSLSDYFFSL